jgi:soluble lytic murein transglycosylase-like protein
MKRKTRDYVREAAGWLGDITLVGIVSAGIYFSGLVKLDPLKGIEDVHVIGSGGEQMTTYKNPEYFRRKAAKIMSNREYWLDVLKEYMGYEAAEHYVNISRYSKKIREECDKQGFDSTTAETVALVESTGNHYYLNGDVVMSSAGATGMFQLMPENGEDLDVDPNNLNQNIRGGITHLKDCYDMFGNEKFALAAYNCGPGRVRRLVDKYGKYWGKIEPKLPKETRRYVEKFYRYKSMLEESRRIAERIPLNKLINHETELVTDCIISMEIEKSLSEDRKQKFTAGNLAKRKKMPGKDLYD